MGTGSFLGVKQTGHGIYHSPLSSSEVKGKVYLYLYSPSGPSWFVLGWNLPIFFYLSKTAVSHLTTILDVFTRRQILELNNKIQNYVLKKTTIHTAQSNEDPSATWLVSDSSNQNVMHFPEYMSTPLIIFNIWENGHTESVYSWFQILPCAECYMLPSGWPTSICSLNANILEHTVPSSLADRYEVVLTSYLPIYEDGTDRAFLNIGI
jgi:hypothetical protein